MKPSFILHKDSLCVLEDLTNEQRGELFYAIYCYQIGQELELSSIIKIAFSQFKNQFVRDEEKFKKTVKARQEAGSKGGKQRVANQANASTTKQTKANQAVSDSDSVNESVSVNNKENVFNILWKDYTLIFLKSQGRSGGTKKKALSRFKNLVELYGIDDTKLLVENEKRKQIGHKDLERVFTEDNMQQMLDDGMIDENQNNSKQQMSFKQQDKEQSDREFEAISQRNIFDVIDEMEHNPNEPVQGVICE